MDRPTTQITTIAESEIAFGVAARPAAKAGCCGCPACPCGCQYGLPAQTQSSQT
ncbi:MAG: hypothetical protein HYX50_05080 [Chloroflexi bacterium]|nr:hypothetical protein [Chloroflexota bacterium]